jgi:hypothetical protein
VTQPPPPQSLVAAYVPAVARAGLSANQALLYLRGEWQNLQQSSRDKLEAAGLTQVAQGMTPRRQTFLRLYAEVQAYYGRREAVANAPINRLPAAAEISKWPAKRPGGYLYQVLVALQRPTGQVYFTQSAYFTQQLVTFQQAAAEAAAVFVNAQADHDSFAGERILGPGFITGVSEFVDDGGGL